VVEATSKVQKIWLLWALLRENNYTSVQNNANILKTNFFFQNRFSDLNSTINSA